MRIDELPLGSNPKALDFKHFPTKQQAVVWRNWELASVKTLAEVLNATEDDILKLASDMGLPTPPVVDPQWPARGYVTLIKANWHLLPYEQLLKLLGWTPEKLSFHLKEEDFLWHKLGYLKPNCETVSYRPLTAAERLETARIREITLSHFGGAKRKERPFDFITRLSRGGKHAAGKAQPGKDIVYSYFASSGDVLATPELDVFPDGLLERYAALGVGGIWLPATLYTLCPLKGTPELSAGYEKRLETLRDIVKRAGRHGIGVYLYLNEPRGMGEAFFEKRPSWKGAFQASDSTYALCTSNPEVLLWLKNACAYVFKEVPGLAGAFTITMSENITNCHSRMRVSECHECPRCAKRPTAGIVAEVNRTIAEGIHSAAPDARVIAWNWAWGDDWEHDALSLLPKDVELMCVSEWGKKLDIGGVENSIVDYSISQASPSEKSLSMWEHAAKLGIKTVAKVQLNNSWECAVLPYLPVPYLVKEHLDKLKQAGVGSLMLSWTLGGYPGGNLELLKKSPEEIAVDSFGKNAAEGVTEAWRLFGDAFRNFPFHMEVLYKAPQLLGPANLLFQESTGYKATMTCLPYDDLDSWRANYPEETFENQFKMLSEEWKSGLDRLFEAEGFVDADKTENFAELMRYASAAYCHFRSAYLQIRFAKLRRNKNVDAILDEEIELAKSLHEAILSDSAIGFEPALHYAYTSNDLMEKVLNCEWLKRHGRQNSTGN